MIDIHSHIVLMWMMDQRQEKIRVPYWKKVYRQGVRTIISTSHRRKGMFETPEEKDF